MENESIVKHGNMASKGLLFVLSPMGRSGEGGRDAVVRAVTSSDGGLSRVSSSEPLIERYVSASLDQEDSSCPTAVVPSGHCARDECGQD